MKKCDFCTMSSPSGKCYWDLQLDRKEDCQKAIEKMTTALYSKNNKPEEKDDCK